MVLCELRLYDERLREKGITLPEPPTPVGAYLPAVRSGNLLFISGMIPKNAPRGKVGRELTVKDGYEAAKICALNALAAVKAELGSLDEVKRVVKVVGYVASGEGFADQHMVVNGASDLFVEVFGEEGRHARVAVGVADLPGNVPVEVEVILELKARGTTQDNDVDRVEAELLREADRRMKAKARSRGPYRKSAPTPSPV